MDKFYTLVFELRSASYPRSLKLEMRKKMEIRGTDQAIAYSPHSTVQVLVKTLSLQEMMASKIEAFLDRGEIRDAYDLEFLVKRGLKAAISRNKANRVVSAIESLTPRDYNVKLGSLLEADQRAYYREKNFAILKEAMADI
jgi:predicted nucleotidyltransferase component of viral defense system